MAAENFGIFTESQIQALEAAKEEAEVHGEIESPHPGFLERANPEKLDERVKMGIRLSKT